MLENFYFRRLVRLAGNEQGQSLVEYSLILGLIVITGLIGLIAMGGGVNSLYNVIETAGETMANSLL